MALKKENQLMTLNGDATLQNATAAGQKFGFLAFERNGATPFPLESEEKDLHDEISRSRFPSLVELILYI